MWFRSIFLKTLRDYRVAILGWGLGIGMLTPLVFGSIATLLADSPDVRAELLALLRNPALRLFGEPVDVLSAGGYATWRLSLGLPLVGIWALLAASRTLRGEEERGALDALLAVPRSRMQVATEKLAAIATALLLMGLLIGLLAFAGGKGTGVELGLDAALFFGLNIALLALVYGSLALLISQFTRERRPAAGITGALLGLSIVLTSAGRTVPNGAWIGRLSPLYYFEMSKPLIPSYGTNRGAMLVLFVVSVVLNALGVALFVRRDVGAAVPLPLSLRFPERPPPAQALPLGAGSLRSVFGRSLRSVAALMLWWGVVIAAYSALVTAILRQAQQNLADLLESLSNGGAFPADLIARFLGGGDVPTNLAFLSVIFTLLAAVVAAFGVALANHWAAEEEEGRLELLLGTPQPRSLVILAPFGAVGIALLVVAGFIFAGVALTAAAVGMKLDTGRVAVAAFGMVPVGLVVASVGYLLSGWLRTAAMTGILIALLLASFMLTFLGPLFHWPSALLQLSIFEQYGSPLVSGLSVPHTLGLLVVAAAALGIATVRFARKDLAR